MSLWCYSSTKSWPYWFRVRATNATGKQGTVSIFKEDQGFPRGKHICRRNLQLEPKPSKACQFHGGLQINYPLPRLHPLPPDSSSCTPSLFLALIRSFRPPLHQLSCHLFSFLQKWTSDQSSTNITEPKRHSVPQSKLSGTPSEPPASGNPVRLFNVMFPQYKGTVWVLRFLKWLKQASLGPDWPLKRGKTVFESQCYKNSQTPKELQNMLQCLKTLADLSFFFLSSHTIFHRRDLF